MRKSCQKYGCLLAGRVRCQVYKIGIGIQVAELVYRYGTILIDGPTIYARRATNNSRSSSLSSG